MKIISWNIAHIDEPWRVLAESDADVALLQEAACPPAGLRLQVDDAPWTTAGLGMRRPWRTAIVCLSDRVRVRWRPGKPVTEAEYDQLHVSRPGTLAVADIEDLLTGETITVISMYGAWENPVAEAASQWIYADASVHRIISDISMLIGRQSGHRIIAAGDINLLFGYGEHGSTYWAQRYATVFERFKSIGLQLLGPQSPYGLQAEPWPLELPKDSLNVPTFRLRTNDPATATRQLDYVFASGGLAERVEVRAMNGHGDWGPSDHCRIMIDVKPE
jgi:endonuclease/exonuclease/phosphatase family metal-dependent hydrolase